MQNFLNHFNFRSTPQNQPIPGANQVLNSALGYSWELDLWAKLDRFLILGTEGGTYYATERSLTVDNVDAVTRCLDADGERTVKRVVEVSRAGRAPKNDPALFVLAMATGLGTPVVRAAALDVLPLVARTGTHLFHFLAYVEGFRGWGRGLRRAIGRWYNEQPAEQLAYQLVKYQQRDGWSHRDALRLAHPKPATEAHASLYHWVTQGFDAENTAPHPVALVEAVRAVKAAPSASAVASLIRDVRLPREVIPTEWLGDPTVWEALLAEMPMEAMVRNLATMTRVGLLAPGSAASKLVAERLRDGDRLRKSRVHPIKLLAALTTYQAGRGARNASSTWAPVAKVVDALDDAFYLSFGNVEPSGKRHVIGLDVSGSMGGGMVAGVPGLTPRVASAAMALVTMAVEPETVVMAFSDRFVPLSISPRQRLDDVLKVVDRLPFGGTDCALPMTWAQGAKVDADAFMVLTDSETWFGKVHPSQALREYRQKRVPTAKLVVCGMVANAFTIADPKDAGMLDVVGFDTATPQLVSDFVAGRA